MIGLPGFERGHLGLSGCGWADSRFQVAFWRVSCVQLHLGHSHFDIYFRVAVF